MADTREQPDATPPDGDDALETAKGTLRSVMKQQLAALDASARSEASTRACLRLASLEAFRSASVVMLYMPLTSEVDTLAAAMRAFQLNKTVCVPRVDWKRRDMLPVEVSSFDDEQLDVDEHGIRTPRNGQIVVPRSIDFLVVPGLAYDATGNRLGRGGGFYDRFLPRLRRSTAVVGLAFDFQVVDDVPVNAQDVRVSAVVTDRRVTHVRRAARRGPVNGDD